MLKNTTFLTPSGKEWKKRVFSHRTFSRISTKTEKTVQKGVQNGVPTHGYPPGGTHGLPPKNSDFAWKFKRSSGSVLNQKCPKWHFFGTPRDPKMTHFLTTSSQNIRALPRFLKKNWSKTCHFYDPRFCKNHQNHVKNRFLTGGLEIWTPGQNGWDPFWPTSDHLLATPGQTPYIMISTYPQLSLNIINTDQYRNIPPKRPPKRGPKTTKKGSKMTLFWPFLDHRLSNV